MFYQIQKLDTNNGSTEQVEVVEDLDLAREIASKLAFDKAHSVRLTHDHGVYGFQPDHCRNIFYVREMS